MSTVYFDCYSGISGDMILGSLIDLGLSVSYLKKELKKLNISGYEINVKKVEKNQIVGTDIDIVVKERQDHRMLSDVYDLIENSQLNEKIKEMSKKIFQKLAEVESKIHNIEIDNVYFHEVGAIDSIIDIVGSVIGIKKLQINNIFCSYLPLGVGFVTCSHGMIPLPAPATVELLKGVPVYSTNIKHELVTPTGAAIITTLAQHFGEMPLMKINKVGYGAGKTEMEHPNLLRVFIGELYNDYDFDITSTIETNIDDMNPEIYDYLIQKLMDNGALDVFLTGIQMKKNRPAVKLSVISSVENSDKIVDIIFNETTTLGVRIYNTRRIKLFIEKRTVKTEYGDISVKIGKINDKIKTISPEYEECRRLAEKSNIPLKDIYDLVKKKLYLVKS